MGELVSAPQTKSSNVYFGFSCAAPSQSKRCWVIGPETDFSDGDEESCWTSLAGCGLALLFFRDEFHVAKFEAEIFDGLADQITVAFADVTELGVRNPYKQNRTLRMIVTGGFEPGFVRGPIDFLFQCIEDEHPRIG